MTDMKRTLLPAALVAVILIAGGWIARSHRARNLPPKSVLDRPQERIDATTGEFITLSNRKWMDLGEQAGYFKNPKTGQYSMIVPIECIHCKAKIAPPRVPPIKTDADVAARDKTWSEFKCPKCGKRPVI